MQVPSALSSLCASADVQHFYFSLCFLVSLSPKQLLPFTSSAQSFTGHKSVPGSLSVPCRRKQLRQLRSNGLQHFSGAGGPNSCTHCTEVTAQRPSCTLTSLCCSPALQILPMPICSEQPFSFPFFFFTFRFSFFLFFLFSFFFCHSSMAKIYKLFVETFFDFPVGSLVMEGSE